MSTNEPQPCGSVSDPLKLDSQTSKHERSKEDESSLKSEETEEVCEHIHLISPAINFQIADDCDLSRNFIHLEELVNKMIKTKEKMETKISKKSQVDIETITLLEKVEEDKQLVKDLWKKVDEKEEEITKMIEILEELKRIQKIVQELTDLMNERKKVKNYYDKKKEEVIEEMFPTEQEHQKFKDEIIQEIMQKLEQKMLTKESFQKEETRDNYDEEILLTKTAREFCLAVIEDKRVLEPLERMKSIDLQLDVISESMLKHYEENKDRPMTVCAEIFKEAFHQADLQMEGKEAEIDAAMKMYERNVFDTKKEVQKMREEVNKLKKGIAKHEKVVNQNTSLYLQMQKRSEEAAEEIKRDQLLIKEIEQEIKKETDFILRAHNVVV